MLREYKLQQERYSATAVLHDADSACNSDRGLQVGDIFRRASTASIQHGS